MKKLVCLLLCVVFVLCGCGSTPAETVPPDTVQSPTVSTEETKPIDEPIVLESGNLTFPITRNTHFQIINSQSLGVFLTPGVSSVIFNYSTSKDAGDIGMGMYATIQQTAWTKTESDILDEKLLYHPMLDTNIYFKQYAEYVDNNLTYYLVGTFYDDEFVHTVRFSTTNFVEEEIHKFTDLLSSITIIGDSSFTSVLKEHSQTTNSSTTPTSEISSTDSSGTSNEYVLNTNTHKFHYAWCTSAKKTKPSNKTTFPGTRDEVISKGYDPCNICNP